MRNLRRRTIESVIRFLEVVLGTLREYAQVPVLMDEPLAVKEQREPHRPSLSELGITGPSIALHPVHVTEQDIQEMRLLGAQVRAESEDED